MEEPVGASLSRELVENRDQIERAEQELDLFIERREGQRVRRATDEFGIPLVEDRPDYDEEWLKLCAEYQRKKRSTRQQEWREHHMRQVRSLSRSVAAMVRHHLSEVQRLDRGE